MFFLKATTFIFQILFKFYLRIIIILYTLKKKSKVLELFSTTLKFECLSFLSVDNKYGRKKSKISNKKKEKKIYYWTYMLWKILKLTLLKHGRTLGMTSLKPSMLGIKSILGPIQLKAFMMLNSRPCSTPSTIKNEQKNIERVVWYTCMLRNIQIDG